MGPVYSDLLFLLNPAVKACAVPRLLGCAVLWFLSVLTMDKNQHDV